ncbi:Gfo/Idh/MocA family protein [Halobaculum sp. D14]|uniref:Gfo/Idh/MocA family protein n=1 Tax=Halobaculum sp. D14 TaxID=3421642 RepID=UPI003EC098DD
MKYAVIGTGYWGSNHARIASELRSEGVIEEAYLCDADEERVSEIAEAYDLPYVTDYADLPDEGVTAATLSTPSPTHHDIAVDLLESGVDLLIEKPLALDSDDAWSIVETADAENRVLAVGHIFRFHPALKELKRRIDRGELGRIKYMNTRRFSFRVPRATTGVLYSLAVHDVDISNYLLDDAPNDIYCRLDSVVRDDIDETATLVLNYDEATSVINESWQVPVFGKQRDLVVVGSEKAAYVDYLEDNVVEIHESRVVKHGDELRALEEGGKTYEVENDEPLRVEVDDFVSACKERTEPSSPGRIGAEVVEQLELAEKSSERNQTVPLDR